MNTSTLVVFGLVALAFFVSLSLYVASAFHAEPDPEEIELKRRDLEALSEIRQRQSRGW